MKRLKSYIPSFAGMLVFSLASGGAHPAVEQTIGQTQQVLPLVAKAMLFHSLDHFFSALCCVARGWDPKNPSSQLFKYASHCTRNLFMQKQALAWTCLFQRASPGNIAIPLVGARSLLRQWRQGPSGHDIACIEESSVQDWSDIF